MSTMSPSRTSPAISSKCSGPSASSVWADASTTSASPKKREKSIASIAGASRTVWIGASTCVP